MDDDFIHRLLLAECDFLHALNSGPHILASCRQTLSALPDALSAARKTGKVTIDTLSLAHSVASRISKVAACFLDVTRGEHNSTVQLQRDCDAMIQWMENLNLNSQSTPLLQDNTSSSPSPNANAQCSSPFVAPAYRWLLDNLHNPYPPAEVKTRIAAASSCQISSVNSWFANARRRIGWTTLCRERFSNCRADMIDAAYRALVEEDPKRALSPEISHAFVTVRVAAEGLYSSTFARTVLAEDLDAILRDVTKDSESVEVGEIEPTNSTKVRAFGNYSRFLVTEQKLQAARDSYPSPDRSITTSPTTSPASVISDPFMNGSEDDVASPIITGSKRRRLSIDTVDQSSSHVRRSVKRLRTSMSSVTHLPSPPSSTNGFDVSSDGDSSTLSPGHSIQPDTSSSRKRRLSDAEDTVNMPKRPCGSIAALDTVSDSLPRFDTQDEQSFDDWFNANSDALFNIPPPVDATEPDSSSSWEVQLFKNYNIPPADTHISSDFDNLLQSIGGDTFVAPSGGVPPSDVAGAPYTASLGSSVPDFSQTNIDWSSFFNDPDVYQSTVYPTFPQFSADSQTPLPEIDLPMLQLPPIAPTVNSQGDTASKQAKLDQLHAMQEAVRRMEQELQSEGIL